jgi:TATA-binding protein-associated factor Taf7
VDWRVRQSDFIEALTHDAFVVQSPRLPDVPKTPLERAFSLFNQRLIREDKHRLIIEGEASLSPKDALTEKMARVLFKISASKEIEERMNQEDILQEDIERAIKKLEHDIREAQREKEEAQKREITERKEKEEAQKGKEEAQREKEGILQQAIQALMKTGLSEENARKALNLS